MTINSEQIAWILVAFEQVCIVVVYICFERYNREVLDVLKDCRATIDHYNKHVKSIVVVSAKTQEEDKATPFKN